MLEEGLYLTALWREHKGGSIQLQWCLIGDVSIVAGEIVGIFEELEKLVRIGDLSIVSTCIDTTGRYA